jgi:hypothetical protein
MNLNRPTWQKAFDVQVGLWRRWNRIDIAGFVEDRRAYVDDNGDVQLRGDEEFERALTQGVHAARATVFYADPFFVSAEMCDLVQVAAESFTPEPLLASEFLSPCGFLLFERPVILMAGQPGDQVRMHYVGFSWIGVEVEEGAGPIGVVLTTYHQWPTGASSDGVPDVYDLELWRFEEECPTPQCAWWCLAQTTLRLMLEFKPASRYKARPDRASRRDAKRSGFEEREVTVVRLRRERNQNEVLGGTANYSCRFMVSGHWRNQWCPSIGRHRQTWIAPYVKGPDDKPFRPTRGRAFTFTR